MEVVMDLFKTFPSNARVVDVQHFLGPDIKVRQDGRGNFALVPKLDRAKAFLATLPKRPYNRYPFVLKGDAK